MKVRDRNELPTPGLGGLSGGQNAPATGPGDAEQEGSRDSVRVSDVARALARLVDHGGELTAAFDDVRADKVGPLRDAIAAGTYTVDPEATARLFLAGSLGLER